jgi:hypothetical protein
MVDKINQRFDSAIDAIRDPHKNERQMEKMKKDPLMSAGMRGFDRLKWDIQAGIDPFNKYG